MDHEPAKFGNPSCIHLYTKCVRWAYFLKICFLIEKYYIWFMKYYFGDFKVGMSDKKG